MYYKLKKLWNDYDAMCWPLKKKSECEEQKWNRGQALAKAIQKAEEDGFIARNCQPDGIGSYSFDQGMN